MTHIAGRIAQAIEAERLTEGTGHAEDEAYNSAIDDALAGVEAVSAEPDPLRDLAHLLDGATVSVDLSTSDHDAGARVFGRVYSAQQEADGSLTILAEQGERNEPDQPRELAEWLVSLDDSRDLGTVERRTAAMGEAITRARKALDKED